MNLGDSISRICSAFKMDGISFALAGGFAFSIHIIPRATTDIDFMIFTRSDLGVIEKSLGEIFSHLISHREPIKGGEFKVWRFVGIDDEETVIDILVSDDEFFAESALKRINSLNFKNQEIPVLSLEDIYIMKKKSTRYQDIHDCKMIEEIKGESLDRAYIEKWI
jgi:hypothetical protein